MNEKQIEALRVWACEISIQLIDISNEHGRVASSDQIHDAMTRLNDALEFKEDLEF